MNYAWHLCILFLIYLPVVAALELAFGYLGILNVAHAIFFGTGAYTAAYIWAHFTSSFAIGVIAAGVVAAMLSLTVSLPYSRLSANSMLMLTLALQTAGSAVFGNWTSVTGGPLGISNVPRPVIMGMAVTDLHMFAVLAASISVMLLAALYVVQLSFAGTVLLAIRDDALVADSLGISSRRLRVEGIALSALITGVCGAIYACYMTYIDPTSFGLDESLVMISMVVVGGIGRPVGPVAGVATILAIPEILRWMSVPSAVAANVRLLIYGALLVVLVLWRPQGMLGRFQPK